MAGIAATANREEPMIGIGPFVVTLLMFALWGLAVYAVYLIFSRLNRISRSLEQIETKLCSSDEMKNEMPDSGAENTK